MPSSRRPGARSPMLPVNRCASAGLPISSCRRSSPGAIQPCAEFLIPPPRERGEGGRREAAVGWGGDAPKESHLDHAISNPHPGSLSLADPPRKGEGEEIAH